MCIVAIIYLFLTVFIEGLTEKFPNTEVVEALIDAGSPVNTAMSNGERPLTLAAMYSAVETIDILIKHGN